MDPNLFEKARNHFKRPLHPILVEYKTSCIKANMKIHNSLWPLTIDFIPAWFYMIGRKFTTSFMLPGEGKRRQEHVSLFFTSGSAIWRVLCLTCLGVLRGLGTLQLGNHCSRREQASQGSVAQPPEVHRDQRFILGGKKRVTCPSEVLVSQGTCSLTGCLETGQLMAASEN